MTEQEKFENDQYENYVNDCNYTRAVRMFYALETLRKHEKTSDASRYCDDYEFIADALQYALENGFTPRYADHCDVAPSEVQKAREVGEKHAQMKEYKACWNNEQGFENNGVCFGDSTTAHALAAMYGEKKYIHCWRVNNGGRILFVDRVNK